MIIMDNKIQSTYRTIQYKNSEAKGVKKKECSMQKAKDISRMTSGVFILCSTHIHQTNSTWKKRHSNDEDGWYHLWKKKTSENL